MHTTLLCITLSASLASQVAQPEPKRHPLAPSLPLLSKEAYAKFDQIIERFILYDIGKLKGAEGRKALKNFNALPDAAIFSLVEKFNKAADFQDTCPAVVIGRKIAKILNASNDTELLTYARENIGVGVKGKRHMGVVSDLRLGAMLRKNRLAAHYKNQKVPGQRIPLPLLTVKQLVKESKRQKGANKQKVLVELTKRDGAEALGILHAFATEQDAQSQKLGKTLLLHHIYRQTKSQLKNLLQDDRPLVRATTAHVIGLRKYPWVTELIDLLEESDAHLRQTARGALLQLTRGRIDFGPTPGASESERAAAVKRWRAWWKKTKKR